MKADPTRFAIAVEEYFDTDTTEWLSKDNIALEDESGNIAAFERQENGIFEGHYFFKARGKEAVKAAVSLLSEIFTYDEVKVIIGLTPLEYLGARWLSRKIGFKSNGVIEIPTGPCEFFILTRQDWENNDE